MSIPKIISKDGKEYLFQKEYPNFFRYIEMIDGYSVCFTKEEIIEGSKNRRKESGGKWR